MRLVNDSMFYAPSKLIVITNHFAFVARIAHAIMLQMKMKRQMNDRGSRGKGRGRQRGEVKENIEAK